MVFQWIKTIRQLKVPKRNNIPGEVLKPDADLRKQEPAERSINQKPNGPLKKVPAIKSCSDSPVNPAFYYIIPATVDISFAAGTNMICAMSVPTTLAITM